MSFNPPVVSPSRQSLLSLFKGKQVRDIQTPALIIDRKIFVENCKKMKTALDTLEWHFRAHIKTHKTSEGAKLQCEVTGTDKIIVSTVPEMYIHV